MCNDIHYYIKQGQMEVIEIKHSHVYYKLHNHSNSYTLIVVLQGNIVLKPEPHYLLLKKGESYCIKPYEVHMIKSDEGYSMIAVSLPIAYIKSKGIECIKKQVEENLMNTSFSSELKENAIQLLLREVTKIDLQKADYNFNEAINRVIKKYKQHPEETFSLEIIGRETYFSPYHYLRSFKQQVGLTPHQFVIQNRIRKAQQLLKENINISEVALLTGFYDESHLIRHFKKIVGITPKAYKRACFNKEQV